MLTKPKVESPFKKTLAEKAILKTAKKNYNAEKRKLNPEYTKRGNNRPLRTNIWSEMPELLKMALAIEVAA